MQETQETQVLSLGGEDLEKEVAAHPSTLAWRIPWTEEPGGLQSVESRRADRTEAIWHAHNRKGEFPLHWGHTGWSRPRRPPLHMPAAGVKLQADLDFRAGWPWKLPGVRHGVGAGGWRLPPASRAPGQGSSVGAASE